MYYVGVIDEMGDDLLKNKKSKHRVTEDEADELIHHILSYLDAQVAVQLCILSKRWRYVWKTLPFLDFSRCKPQFLSNIALTKFVESFLHHRNHQHEISDMKLSFSIYNRATVPPNIYKFITYAVQQNVQTLDVQILSIVGQVIKLSTFSSNSLKELNLDMRQLYMSESDCWHLPALTNLNLSWFCVFFHEESTCKLPQSCLTCLTSLQTLSLFHFELPNSVTFPALTTLNLVSCKLPQKFWDLPALLNLTLSVVESPEDNLSEVFPALVNLRNLTLFLSKNILADFLIKCPQLVNLEISISMTTIIGPSVKIIVLAPKIRNLSSNGFFPITFGDSELENVNVKLKGNSGYKDNKLRNYYRQVEQMFVGLGSARILTLDLDTIKALTAVQDVLVDSPSPFYNLKYVKIPTSYKESCISDCLKRYLLGCCPEARIVTTFPLNDLIARSEVASVRPQNVVPQELLAAPTKVLINSENIPRSVDMGVQEEHVVQNSVVHAEGKGIDQVISSTGNRDFGVWRGHEVNSEFVCLLDLIISKYPETFRNLTAKNKMAYAMKLNMLCTSVNKFTKISLTEVTTEMIAEYRNIVADLQDLGFNLSWLVCRLNYIEQLCLSQPLIPQLHAIDCHISDAKTNLKHLESRVNDAKTKLEDLHTLRAEKMQEIQKAFGAMGANLAVGNIGDHLFTGP